MFDSWEAYTCETATNTGLSMQTVEGDAVAMDARGGWVAYPECGGFRYELGGCQGCSDQGREDRAVVICL